MAEFLDGVEQGTGSVAVSSGAGVPSSTPAAIGDRYVDTTNDAEYVAMGTASSADWSFSSQKPKTSTVSGSAVTEVFITENFIDGAVYQLTSNMEQAIAGALISYGVAMDGDSADTYYSRCTTRYKNGASVAAIYDSAYIPYTAGQTSGTGEVADAVATIKIVGTMAYVYADSNMDFTSAFSDCSYRYDDGVMPASAGIVAGVASQIAVGSKVTLQRIA
jgi:hypothetical protein